jgi:hypothetical protein
MVYHGYNANVQWVHPLTGVVDISGKGNDVSLTVDIPLADITGFGSVAKSFVGGQYSWKATYKAVLDTGAAGTSDALGLCALSNACGSIVLCLEGSVASRSFWKGSAFMTSYASTSNLGGAVTVTASFQGSGPATRAICGA